MTNDLQSKIKPLRSDFGERLDDLLARRGRGAASALAKHLDVSSGYISALRRGDKANPSREIISGIAEFFGVNELWLLSGEGSFSGEFSPGVLREEPSSPCQVRSRHAPNDIHRMTYDTMTPEELVEAHAWFARRLISEPDRTMRMAFVANLESIASSLANHNRSK